VFNQAEARVRLIACGVTATQAHQISALVQKWVECNGEEQTVKRIKSMKVDLARHFAGLPPAARPALFQKGTSWVKTRNGLPVGPFGVLFRLPRDRFWVAWNAIMVYTGIMFQDPDLKCTPTQISEMRAAITRPEPNSDALVEGLRLVHVTPLRVNTTIGRLWGDPLVKYRYSETRRAPEDFHTVPEKEGVLSSVQYLIERSVWTASRWDMIQPTLEGLENPVRRMIEINLEDERRSGPPDLTEKPKMGVLALIPEPGYKLRFAANPGRVYQSLTGPLGRRLFGVLRDIPNDFTYDQEAGIRFCQARLAEGKPSVSMDLSNATDRFPLELELAFLRRMGTEPEWLHLLRDLCRGDWYYQSEKGPRSLVHRISWTVGSPLGVFPTFAAFSLGHHAVVQACFQECGVEPNEDGSYDYAIVGDDFTVFDRQVAAMYRKVMDRLGVPISESKTLDADHTSEFLGRIITATEAIQGFKWKGKCSDESFVDLARNLGQGSLVLMRKRQRDVIRVIAPLPEPLGLGWNPHGQSWSTRVGVWFDELLKEPDERTREFTNSRRHSHTLLYSSKWHNSPSRFDDWRVDGEILTSDQDVLGLYPSYLPGWSGDQWGDEMWPNLLEIARFRGNDPATQVEFQNLLRLYSTFERRKDVPSLVQWERRIRRILKG